MHRQQLLKETLFEKNSSTIFTFCAKMKPVTGILNITGNDNSNFILQDQIQDYCQSNISAYINFEITVSPGSKLKLAPFFFFFPKLCFIFFSYMNCPFWKAALTISAFPSTYFTIKIRVIQLPLYRFSTRQFMLLISHYVTKNNF